MSSVSPQADFLLIDKGLAVRPLKDALVANKRWLGPDVGAVAGSGDPPFPVSPDGSLRPGVLYGASDGSKVAFALPTYSLQVVDGRYASGLHWRRPEDDPNGPIAFLTISMALAMPASDGRELRQIDHNAVARLLYELPVRGADGSTSSAQFSFDLGVLEPAGPAVRTGRFPIVDKPDFDRIWQAMTDPASSAHVEVRCFATVGRRTWRQIVKDRVDLPDQFALLEQKQVLLTHMIDPVPKRFVRPSPDTVAPAPESVVAAPPRAVSPADRPLGELFETKRLDPVVLTAAPQTVNPAVVAAVTAPQTLRELSVNHALVAIALSRAAATPPIVLTAPAGAAIAAAPLDTSRMTLHTAFRPKVDVALRNSDLTVGARRAVPIRVITAPDGEPALVRVPASCVQDAVPFTFSPDTNAYMFDVPGDLRPTTSHILLRFDFDPGGGREPMTYYQDSALPDHFYYRPQEFLIPRRDAPPYLPEIQIAFFDVVTTGDGSGSSEGSGGGSVATIQYRARMVYRAVAHVEHAVLAALERHLTTIRPEPKLELVLPESAELRLSIPRDAAGGHLVEEQRTVAEVAFDNGIVDEIELSPTELAAVLALLESGGVLGTVHATLLGSSASEVNVRLSLRDTTGPLLEHAFRGPVGEGSVRVSVRNRIESPLSLVDLYGTPVGDGAMAYPQSPLGTRIDPGASADLDYRVVPPSATVLDLDPLLRLAIETNVPALLPQLLVNQGYSSETFTVRVSTDPGVFGRAGPGGGEPLTALKVEFEDDASVILDAGDPTDDVNLRIPILSWLLKDGSGQRYRYRVSNLAGTGASLHQTAQGPFVDGEGTGTLTVVPVS